MKTNLSAVKKFRNIWVVLIITSIIISYSFVDHYFEISKNLEIFTSIYKELNAKYVDDIEPGTLMRTGIDAMLESLDPYTNFISEADIADYTFQTTGKYGGIGARIRNKDEHVVIVEPYEGYAAFKAGLRAGDVILEIDEQSTKEKDSEDIRKLLRGSEGTKVSLLIRRPPSNEEMMIEIVREEINIDNVPYFGMVNDEIGYIKLSTFTQKSGRNVLNALTELKKNKDLSGVILDLRDNQGGLLDEAINVCNVFLEKGKEIVRTRGKIIESERIYPTLNSGGDSDIPLVVLVNRSSASASEIVAGAIQDLDRGVIIGRQSFGKGLVQTTRPIAYKNRLKVTIAKYYVPSGRCIQAIDYSNKNKDGDALKIPDSLRTEFWTANGRSVFDGAGIAPDLEIIYDKLSNISRSLMRKQLIFDYVTIYRSEIKKIVSAKEFNVDDNLFSEFVDFLSDKEYDYSTKTEDLLADLIENAEEERYYENIKEDLEALETKILHDKAKDLDKFKEEIKKRLRYEIVSRYYYQAGRIEASFDSNPDILKAVEVLSNKEEYTAILQPEK
ncbi:MAG: S41 family peptidase [Bacteroidetes bacterium]|nr:S41 family peptidase [Bacteroidota bacterium]